MAVRFSRSRGYLLVCCCALIALLVCVMAEADVIVFPDPNLESVIREAIGKPTGDIHDSDLAGLTHLEASHESITNLQGIEHCLALSRLSLELNEISDISPLAGLASLTTLSLNFNEINDITPLAGLTSLTTLSLFSNQISDIGVLAGMTSLQHLSLSGNRISSISPLAGLTSLITLSLSSNQISDITPLAALPRIWSLDLDGNQISDIGVLAGMTSLQHLSLRGNRISSISPLAGLANLTSLLLDDNRIRDISPIAGLRDVSLLHLRRNQISDISSLAGLTDLSDLALDGNQIIDIRALAGLPLLDTLDLDGNRICDVSPLAGLTRVHMLFINANEIRDIGPLVAISSSMPLIIDIRWNYLSLDPASDTMGDLQTLLARGVCIEYEPQRAAPPSHAITTPSVVNGTASGETGELLVFEASGAECSLGHRVEYRFDWGDGSFSRWSSSGTAAHTYWSERVLKGYTVRAQARCADDHSIISDWSPGHEVRIGVDLPSEGSAPSDGTGVAGDSAETLGDSTPGRVGFAGLFDAIVRGLEYVLGLGDSSQPVAEELNRPPIANITLSSSSEDCGFRLLSGSAYYFDAEVGDVVRFSAEGAKDLDSGDRIVSYAWDWSNNGIIDWITTDPVVRFVFESAGEHEVRLVVTDTQGLTGEKTRHVSIRERQRGFLDYISDLFGGRDVISDSDLRAIRDALYAATDEPLPSNYNLRAALETLADPGMSDTFTIGDYIVIAIRELELVYRIWSQEYARDFTRVFSALIGGLEGLSDAGVAIRVAHKMAKSYCIGRVGMASAVSGIGLSSMQLLVEAATVGVAIHGYLKLRDCNAFWYYLMCRICDYAGPERSGEDEAWRVVTASSPTDYRIPSTLRAEELETVRTFFEGIYDQYHSYLTCKPPYSQLEQYIEEARDSLRHLLEDVMDADCSVGNVLILPEEY